MGGGAIASLLAFGACSNDEKDEPENEPEGEYTEADYAAAASLSSTDENFHSTTEGYALWFSAEGGSATINVTCGCAWTAESDSEWLTIEYDGSSLTATAASATSDEASTSSSEDTDDESGEDESARAATITFYTSESHISFCPVSVTQSSEEPEYEEENGESDEGNDTEGDDTEGDDTEGDGTENEDGTEDTAAISLSANSLSIAAEGSTETVTVTANYSWTASCEADWITLSPAEDGTSLSVTIDRSLSTSSRSADITLACAGETEGNTATATLTINQDAASIENGLVFEYTLTSAASIALPLAGTVSCLIDWGDGGDLEEDTANTKETTTYPTHTYSDAGTYYVSVGPAEEGTAAVTSINYYNTTTGAEYLTALKSWGKDGTTALTSMQNAFRGCSALKSLPDETAPFSAVTTYTYAFSGCTSLASIPADLFGDIDNTTDNYSDLFYGDTALTEIPEGLFDALDGTTAYNFQYAFYGCTALTTVPTSLFDSQKAAAIHVSNCFNGCSAWVGESPYTLATDGETHVHLYDRGDYTSEGFASISATYSKSVFTGCTNLTDYNSIPSAWGGGASAD